jgi:hypothetical protein
MSSLFKEIESLKKLAARRGVIAIFVPIRRQTNKFKIILKKCDVVWSYQTHALWQ